MRNEGDDVVNRNHEEEAMNNFDLRDIPTEGLYALHADIQTELQARCEAERARLHEQMQDLAARYRVDVAYFQEGFPKKRGRPGKAKPNGAESPVEGTAQGQHDHGIDSNA